MENKKKFKDKFSYHAKNSYICIPLKKRSKNT